MFFFPIIPMDPLLLASGMSVVDVVVVDLVFECDDDDDDDLFLFSLIPINARRC